MPVILSGSFFGFANLLIFNLFIRLKKRTREKLAVKKKVIKSDGRKQPFNESKILNSLKMAGTSSALAKKTTEKLNKITVDGTATDTIYKDALKDLRKYEPRSALKYSLKRAIMDMGPDGYTFEKYVARIFNSRGYETEHGRMVTGRCVKHELDVIAKKDDRVYIIECKYHNDRGTKSNIKTALYVHSRYLDIREEFCDEGKDIMEVWLVTNTKVTADVKQYAGCVGMNVLAWKYPGAKNLQYYIENNLLYPISILPGLSGSHKDLLYDNDVITVKDIDFLGQKGLMELTGISTKKAIRIFKELELLIH